MHHCEVVACGKTAEDGVSLHRVPKSDLTGRWSQFLEIANQAYPTWKPPKLPSICNSHFATSCVIEGPSGRRSVLKGHNPSILSDSTSNNLRCYQCQPDASIMMEVAESSIHFEGKDLLAIIAEKDSEIKRLKSTIEQLREDKRVLQQRVMRNENSRKRSNDTIKELKDEISSWKFPKLAYKERGTQTDMESLSSAKLYEFFMELQKRKQFHGSYSKTIQEFSMKLHYLSPKGYTFVREYFENCLPEPRTFGRWTKHIDTRPGLFKSSLNYIKDSNIQQQKVYNLILDEIHIRKKITWDGKKMHGFADYGALIKTLPDTDAEAKTALFMMVTEINGSKAIPLGYILCDHLNGDMIADIIKSCLYTMNMINGKIISVTFDGLKANIRAAELLGANLDVRSASFQSHFLHPVTHEPVFVLLDSSHMLKLMRNQLKDCGVFFDEDGNEINWKFVQQLIDLQNKEGVRAANKVTVRHEKFETQKMKTRLAAQTISNSVAVAMQVCEKIGLPEFQGCRHTAIFFQLQDRGFDMTNSQTKGKGYKAPLSLANQNYWKGTFKNWSNVLMSLTYFDKNKREKIKFVDSNKGTFAVGLIITMRSIENMVYHYVGIGKPLTYLSTYKLSQDFLEMFFAKIRSRLGCNDNPSAFELLHLLKYVLAVGLKSSLNANCTSQEEVQCCISPIGTVQTLSDRPNDVSFEPEYLPTFNSMSLFVQNVVIYIAGYVCRELCSTLDCPNCILGLLPVSSEVEGAEYTLINEKDNGGLCKPSKDVITLCKITESYIRSSKDNGIRYMDSKKIVNKVSLECVDLGLFSAVYHDVKNEAMFHVLELIKSIARTYCKIRLHYIAKEATFKVVPTTNRNVCRKSVHFGGN